MQFVLGVSGCFSCISLRRVVDIITACILHCPPKGWGERFDMRAGNNVGDNVLLTPAFKGTVPVGLLIAADMMVSTLYSPFKLPGMSYISMHITAVSIAVIPIFASHVFFKIPA